MLIRPRAGFPRRTTTFAVLSTRRWLRLRETVRLPGDFSYDALSPDGRSLFLINYVSPSDPSKYRVRVYDLARNRLEPKAIVDPREEPDEMNGLPLSRAWARAGAGRTPCTRARAASRSSTRSTRSRARRSASTSTTPRSRRGNLYELRLLSAARGARLDIRRKDALLATIDTASFRVRTGPEAARAVRPAATDNNPPGPGMRWPLLAVALLGCMALLRLATRRRASRRSLTRSPQAGVE